MPSTPNVPVASLDSGFTPRKEFIREQRTTTNTFSLLAISGSNAIRLYSFPIPVISALRHLFDQRINITAFREDAAHNLCEFSLKGKPWTSPKRVNTEKLLVDVLAVIYHHGYSFLSSIDYGREPDDRLAMAFSKPSALPEPSRSGSPFHSSSNADVSGSCVSQLSKGKRAPFALSFPSGTTLRVIDPPLHSTPAILAAVRGAWPRGVSSEKKVGEASFEFKLKGYKWFQEDTFATDSLRHILTLLSSLDMHSFSLLTSLSLSNRSRVKDLWIFTGPASDQDFSVPESPTPSVVNLSEVDSRPVQGPSADTAGQIQHKRAATVPAQPSSHFQTAQHHTRAATDNALHASPSTPHVNATPPSPLSATPNNRSGGLLRKPAPRAQVPVSVIYDNDDRDQRRDEPGLRAVLPSTVSSDIDNMTGVGAAGRGFNQEPGYKDVFYESPPSGDVGRSSPATAPVPMGGDKRPRSMSPPSRQHPLQPVSSRSKTPPLLTSHPSPTSSSDHAPPTTPPTFAAPQPQAANSIYSGAAGAPLLGPGVFRDSAFSSSTEASVEIPIKWTGVSRMEADENQERRPKKACEERAGHTLPGGWAPTPVKEESEEVFTRVSIGKLDTHRGSILHDNRESERPVREVASRVDSPELTSPDERPRKSEAGVVGIVPPSPSSPKPLPSQKSGGKEAQSEGQGWVLVNLEGKRSHEEQGSEPEHPIVRSPGTGREDINPKNSEKKPSSEQASMSPAAKAIVMIDALDAKSKSKSKSKSNRDDSGTGGEKGVKKFFSASRKTSGMESTNGNHMDAAPDKVKTKTRGGLREKLSRLGTTEALRAADTKRRSID